MYDCCKHILLVLGSKWWSRCPMQSRPFYLVSCIIPLNILHHTPSCPLPFIFHSIRTCQQFTSFYLGKYSLLLFPAPGPNSPTMLTHNASLICHGESLPLLLSFPWGISQTSSFFLSFFSYLSHSFICHSNLLTLEPSILAMTVDSCLQSHLPLGSLCISRSVCPACLQFTASPWACVFT